MRFIGAGISGGEEGALKGPSIMPSGDPDSWQLIKPIFEAIAAKVDDEPCVTHIGLGGSGHFVKMVHNGIEYGDMQLICEAYHIFKAAGFEWREPGCSMCLAMNDDRLEAGKRCASTSNRNFEGRQGRGGRTHLVSPAMAAAAAIHGHFVDIRGEA